MLRNEYLTSNIPNLCHRFHNHILCVLSHVHDLGHILRYSGRNAFAFQPISESLVLHLLLQSVFKSTLSRQRWYPESCNLFLFNQAGTLLLASASILDIRVSGDFSLAWTPREMISWEIQPFNREEKIYCLVRIIWCQFLFSGSEF